MGSVAHHHAGGFEAGRGHAGEALCGQERAHFCAQFGLRGFELVETDGFGFLHHLAQNQERIGGHGGVISVAAVFKSGHDGEPFFQIE